MVKKERLDKLLVEQGFVDTKEKAKALIMAGMVLVGNKRFEKAGDKVPSDSIVSIKKTECSYLSTVNRQS